MRTALPQFADWLRIRQFSDGLIETREKHLTYFLDWCEERAVTTFSQVSRNVLDSHQRALFYYRKPDGKPLAVSTQFARLCSLKAFLKWAARYRLIEVNPAAEMVMPKLPTRIPRDILSTREMEAVLNAPDVDEILGLRDRAILEVFCNTGIRRSELAHLALHDVDAARGTLMIREGKGKTDRMVPLGTRALAWIERYLKESRPQLVVEPDDQVLFLSKTGEMFHKDALGWLARRYIEAAGVEKRGACHLFRHSVATMMLENGADIRFIQALLGHRVMDTTAIYTRVAIGKLQEVLRTTHPLAMPADAVKHDDDVDKRSVERAALIEELAADDD